MEGPSLLVFFGIDSYIICGPVLPWVNELTQLGGKQTTFSKYGACWSFPKGNIQQLVTFVYLVNNNIINPATNLQELELNIEETKKILNIGELINDLQRRNERSINLAEYLEARRKEHLQTKTYLPSLVVGQGGIPELLSDAILQGRAPLPQGPPPGPLGITSPTIIRKETYQYNPIQPKSFQSSLPFQEVRFSLEQPVQNQRVTVSYQGNNYEYKVYDVHHKDNYVDSFTIMDNTGAIINVIMKGGEWKIDQPDLGPHYFTFHPLIESQELPLASRNYQRKQRSYKKTPWGEETTNRANFLENKRLERMEQSKLDMQPYIQMPPSFGSNM